jgi:beta-mannosidase
MKISSKLIRILFSAVAVLILSGLDTIELSYGRNLPSAAMDRRSEMLLSGNDWELGAFPMGEGERQKAFAFNFAGPDFRRVPVPAEIQTTLGLKGMELYRHSREISSINNKEWWYRKTFTVPLEHAGKSIRLVFEGSDYFTSVWLNGEKLGDHEGCYTQFSFDITSRIKLGQETLLAVKVTCPWLPKDRSALEYFKGSFALIWPGAQTRSAQLPDALSFIWAGIPGIGNAILTLGLIRDVKLEITPSCHVEDLYVYTKSLNPDGSATLGISGTVRNDGKEKVRRTLNLIAQPDNFTGDSIPLSSQALILPPGITEFKVDAVIKKPRLWWSWELGAQNLYRMHSILAGPAASGTDNREVRFGIRTIERHEDLGYRLNGKHLFIRGVWYPMGSYYSSQNTRAMYETDLLLLRHANANTLVNHTVVEKRDFYELCDELGLLIEVQMPFSQVGPLWVIEQGHPRREAYLKSAFDHARNIIEQKRNHPSIITWAPYAECEGHAWSSQYGVLREGMKKIVAEYAAGAIYHWAYCTSGEDHNWSATAGMSKSDDYRTHFDLQLPFISEYGSCAMSSVENLYKWYSPDELWSDKNPRTPGWYYLPIDINAHAYLSSFRYIEGLNSLLWWATQVIDGDIRSTRELVEASQLFQAFKARYCSEAYRRKKYKNFQGMRWWAYKDPAPGHQWGFLDFDQTPKMAYYSYKKSCAPLSVNFAFRDELQPQTAGTTLKIPVWIVNDLRSEISLDVQCEITDLQGNRAWNRAFQATIREDDSKSVGEVEWTIPETNAVRVYALRAMAKQRGGELNASNTIYIKVVPPPEAAIVEGIPKLEKKCRVLLIGLKMFSESLAQHLRQLNAEVDVIDEDRLDRFEELREAESLKRKYDVVWLAPFESLWKVLDDGMGNGLAQAIRLGVGFVHTGGNFSFRGDVGRGACLDFTPLAEVLPVKLRSRNDLNLLNSSKDVRVLGYGWTDAGLKEVGMGPFNETEPKTDSHLIMKIGEWPLLATGRFGQGHTVAFMGFTPVDKGKVIQETIAPLGFNPSDKKELSPMWLCLYAQMIMSAQGENPEFRYAAAVAINKPVMQLLKEQPAANLTPGPQSVHVPIKDRAGRFSLDLSNGERFARLVRVRAEWKEEVNKPHVMLYSDNYFDLLPHEKRTLEVDLRLATKPAEEVEGTLVIEGTNVPEQRIPISLKAE